MDSDASTIAALLAVDPVGLGGAALRCSAGSLRDEWMALLRNLLPAGTPLRRAPLNITDTALLGGLDLGATLHSGKPVAARGLLCESDGGLVLLPMAERMSSAGAARFCAVLDTQQVVMQRDGISAVNQARIGVIAMDEGVTDDERMPAALLERLAFRVTLDPAPPDAQSEEALQWSAQEVAAARKMLASVTIDDESTKALCAAALALGVDSLRSSLFAVKAACTAAALAGSLEVLEEHVALAARLVLAPRATRFPQPEAEPEADQEPPQPPQEQPEPQQTKEDSPDEDEDDDEDTDDTPDAPSNQGEMAERVLDAVQAAIPAGLLAALRIGDLSRAKTAPAGRSGAGQKSQSRGRPICARKGEPRAGQRLNVIETLRAAAPWQKLRQLQAKTALALETTTALPAKKIHVRKEDFHVSRFRQLGQTTTVFVVDASGSSALNRLAEAKGAVELLLADCYVRRDSVAVLAFRGKTAEVLLPPTRSLTRAKRSLSGLPGGGGTPLASGIDAAVELASQIRRKGETPIIVLLTDGRGNIARSGAPGRAQATADATLAARQVRLSGMTALLLDTSPQPQAAAQTLAAEMGARYLPLPYAGAQVVSQAVRAVTGLGAGPR
jgi:magnesium chelatase subunit D